MNIMQIPDSQRKVLQRGLDEIRQKLKAEPELAIGHTLSDFGVTPSSEPELSQACDADLVSLREGQMFFTAKGTEVVSNLIAVNRLSI